MKQENLHKNEGPAGAFRDRTGGKTAGWLLAGLAGLAMGCAADRDYIRHHLSEVPSNPPPLAAAGQL